MRDVTGPLVSLLVFLVGRATGVEPTSGYCIGNQCFALVQNPGDFAAAQKQCRDLEGHLMTVRSSVAHDVLLILLENTTGRFWIGLQLMTGCPDAAAELRGFQWVTKDSQSDFFDWAPGFDSSCSSHRCVSVSRESNFKWVQEPCGEEAVGFLCEFGFTKPCKGLTVAEGESVTYMTLMGFGGDNLLSLPPGSIATRMPSEIKSVCFSQQWLQAPWSCEIGEGGCEHKCAVDPKQVPSCYCPPGQSVNPANKVTCEVGVEDPCLALGCQHACYASGDSHACMCDHGYKLAADGRSCVDFNDCTDQRQCPGDNFACVNTEGGFACVCRAGYATAPGGLCVDENECVSAPCEHECANTAGSYTCSCYDGYKVDPASPDRCKLHCGREECPAECDPNDAYQCYCPEGYVSEQRGGHTFCIDIDECEYLYCDQHCENKFGGYVCSCSPGYRLVGEYSCVKSEEEDATSPASVRTSTPHVTHPDPTKRPSGVPAGGLVGIIVCTALSIVLLVCLAHHILNRRARGKMETSGALKAEEEEEAHGLRLTSDTY